MITYLSILSKYLDSITFLKLCILIPIFREVKVNNKTIYISINKNNNKLDYKNFCNKFSNIIFEIQILTNDINYNFRNCKNVNLTINMQSNYFDFTKITNNKFINFYNNFNGINKLEICPNKTREFLFFKNIHSLNLSNLNNMNVLYILNVKNLYIYRCNKLNYILNNNSLQLLSLVNINYNLDIHKFKNLKNLSLCDCNFLNNDVLKKIIDNLKILKILVLNYSKNFNDVSCLKDIPHLELVGCSNILTGIDHLSNTKYLDLSYNNNLRYFQSNNNQVLKFCNTPIKIFNFSNLKSLELISNMYIKYEDTKLFKNIEYLNLSDTNITDIHPILDLKELDLSFCKNIKNIPFIKSLKSLNISNSINIESVNINFLNFLNITNCSKIKNKNNLKAKKIIDIKKKY
jgi:hypothetical protein